MAEGEREIEFGQCVWEWYPIKIQFNYDATWSIEHEHYNCPHLQANRLKAVVVGTNEGGYCTTGICCECLVDKLKAEGWEQEDKRIEKHKRK